VTFADIAAGPEERGMGVLFMIVALVIGVGTLAWIVTATARSIRDERDRRRSIWREFGLSIVLMVLFFASWGAQAILQWQEFTDDQRAMGQPVKIGDFLASFGQSTFENWQSEFLQLFAFVTLAALYVHKGSSESKDGTEKLEASLRRIEERLGTLPPAAGDPADRWKLPATPLEAHDRAS
jgi:hypothetical protein